MKQNRKKWHTLVNSVWMNMKIKYVLMFFLVMQLLKINCFSIVAIVILVCLSCWIGLASPIHPIIPFSFHFVSCPHSESSPIKFQFLCILTIITCKLPAWSFTSLWLACCWTHDFLRKSQCMQIPLWEHCSAVKWVFYSSLKINALSLLFFFFIIQRSVWNECL